MLQKSTKKWFGWLVCGVGALFYSYEYFLRIAPSVMEAELMQHYSIMSGGFGLLSSFYYFAYVPMQLPVGVLMDRYKPRILLVGACLICVLGTLLFASTDLFSVAALGRFMVGFGSAFAFVGVLKLATIWLPSDRLAMISGLASALGTLGAIGGDNLLGWLVDNSTWQHTLYVASGYGIILIILMWLVMRDKNSSALKQSVVGTGLGTILCSKQIWLNGMFGCLIYLPTTVLAELWGIPYLQQAHHLTKPAAELGNSLMFLGLTFGAPLMGWLSDHFHNRKKPMFIGALFSTMIIVIILYVPGLSLKQLYILMFGLGIFYGAQAIVFAVAKESAPAAAGGTAMAVTNMIVMMGGMFMQPLIGFLLDLSLSARAPALDITHLTTEQLARVYTTHDYQSALMAIPVGIAIAAVLTFFIKETHADNLQ